MRPRFSGVGSTTSGTAASADAVGAPAAVRAIGAVAAFVVAAAPPSLTGADTSRRDAAGSIDLAIAIAATTITSTAATLPATTRPRGRGSELARSLVLPGGP